MKKQGRDRRGNRSSGADPRAQSSPAIPAIEHPSATAQGYWCRFQRLLRLPVSGASLAVFRISFGLVMALEAYSLCRPDVAAIGMGSSPLQTYYMGSDITFNFPYAIFSWLPLLPAPLIYAMTAMLALGGVLMALGYFYRLGAAMVFVGWGYFFAVESTRTYWQSHYYMELLLAFLMIWLPAAQCYSLDARRAGSKGRSGVIPYWPVLLLRGQLVIIYFYAGVAKWNADWICDAVPLRWALREEHVTAPFKALLSAGLFERFNDLVHSVGFAYFLSWTGVLFDLGVGFGLLIRRTRIFSLMCMLLFHLTNHTLIYDNIGWFPLAGAATALIFLDPDWPMRVARWLRRPIWARPDWRWLIGGTVLAPGLGAALGWKLKPSPPVLGNAPGLRVARVTFAFFLGWLVFQSLMPIRHYFIAGDGRFTYEGLSFSWRLKADEHSALPVEISVKDTKILATNENGSVRVDWPQWHGERLVYGSVSPAQIDWASLPEVFILLEPVLGERILYNPYGGPSPIRTEVGGRARVREIWQTLYGRQPRSVQSTVPVDVVFNEVTKGLSVSGNREEAAVLSGIAEEWKRGMLQRKSPESMSGTFYRLRSWLLDLTARNSSGELMAFLRQLHPFALSGFGQHAGSFLLIDDPQLVDASTRKVNRAQWKLGAATSGQPGTVGSEDGQAMEILTEYPGLEHWEWIPQACIIIPRENPARGPRIFWNSRRDISPSKFIHISNQPFFLRRYARRVAQWWEKEYARRPEVHALAMVAFNGRPHQQLVDPDQDLASVSVNWFTHNAWVRDLELPRIPRAALEEHTR